MDINMRAILLTCRSVENLCAELYFAYAEMFANDKELAELWRKTAYEEQDHSNVIQLALNCKDLDLLEAGFDLIHYRQLEQGMRAKIAQVRQLPVSAVEALQNSIALEKRLLECHLLSAAQFAKREEGRLFETLSASEKTHLSALEEALAKLS